MSLKKPKGTVIHRTTSETLRLGDDSNQRIVPTISISRKKSQVTSPSCSFQITGILINQEDESADDLDESHTDEISRVTDNETPSFSEDSRDDQQPASQPIFNAPIVEEPLPPTQEEEPKKPKKANINELGRFRVVKLRSMTPFSRGRWTCYDYSDDTNTENKQTTIKTSCQSTNYLYSGSILLPDPIPLYVPISTTIISSQCTVTTLPNARVSFANSCNSVDTVINNSSLDSNQNKQCLSSNINTISPFPGHQEITVAVARVETGLNPNDNAAASVSCGTATIDTKIEHALDVVKNHLTHAVRLEVEELKIKINELVERISFLEYENDLLRANVAADVLANLGNIRRL
ncbi:unnamed protein product [Ceutorhynchus assimilis]|uniref:TSC22 domain family protein 2 n=1 Tax=Ceutorhynchus assimilis TaxID=467358 RepID=A0A9P0GR65_9CUCU|nr:unnamed protein product [Ceutorhynchus assimilis]